MSTRPRIVPLLLCLVLVWLHPARAAASEPPPVEAPVVDIEVQAGAAKFVDEAPSINLYQLLLAKELTVELTYAGEGGVELSADGEVLCTLQAGASLRFTSAACPKLFEGLHAKLQIKVGEGALEPVPLDTPELEGVLSISHDRSGDELRNPTVDTRSLAGVDAGVGFWLRGPKGGFTFFPGKDRLVPIELVGALEALEDPSAALVLASVGGEPGRVGLALVDRDAKRSLSQQDLEEQCARERDAMMSPLAQADAAELDGKAQAQAASPDKKTRRQLDRDYARARDRAARKKDWGYVVCVDMVSDNPKIVVRTTRKGADVAGEAGGVHFYEGRPIWVRVWHRAGEDVEVSLAGERSRTNFNYIPSGGPSDEIGTQGGERAKLPPGVEEPFNAPPVYGLEADQIATLEVEVRAEGETAPRASYSHGFDVSAVYLGAIRVGFAGSWAPFDRKYAKRSLGTGNSSQVIVTEAGLDNSLAYLELVAGYSVFFQPIYAGERTMTGGFLFGVGVVSGSQEFSVDVISSVHAGLEWDIGRDFSLAGTVALRRTEILRDGYVVGDAVAEDETFTRFGVTPTFGLMLTWSPDFTKAIGRAGTGL